MTEAKTTTTLAYWKKSAVHDITLATGEQVAIKLPNLPELVSSGEFPNHLVDVAIKVTTGETKVSKEEVMAQAEFYRELVSRTVVEPKLTPEDVTDLPFEDVELLAAIATRQRDVDALGHHLAGLDKSEDWRKFRGIEYLD